MEELEDKNKKLKKELENEKVYMEAFTLASTLVYLYIFILYCMGNMNIQSVIKISGLISELIRPA